MDFSDRVDDYLYMIFRADNLDLLFFHFSELPDLADRWVRSFLGNKPGHAFDGEATIFVVADFSGAGLTN